MLIRFVVKNLFSFGEETEFNLLSNKSLKTLQHHKYKNNGIELLKMSSIYGANGAGKSNLIKAIALMKLIVTQNKPVSIIDQYSFKLKDEKDETSTLLAIEFIEENIPFYYALEIDKGVVLTEELYESGLGLKKDILIFERKTNFEGVTSIQFSDEFEKDEKSSVYKSVLLESFVKSNETLLQLLSKRENIFLQSVIKAFSWFYFRLQILSPNSKTSIIQNLESNLEFKVFAEKFMRAIKVGITGMDIQVEKLINSELENTDFHLELGESPMRMIGFSKVEEIMLAKDLNGSSYFKRIRFQKLGKNNSSIDFFTEDESEGTIRMLDLSPAFFNATLNSNVILIDEIEHSIHPLLIKELISKFSLDENTKGQLIFTTHESNLLDQEIFRTDEIWFAEKGKSGSTKLYSLSDYKEHKTIDIQKGYLTGRYGSIPFLGNLHDLNWHTNVIEASTI